MVLWSCPLSMVKNHGQNLHFALLKAVNSYTAQHQWLVFRYKLKQINYMSPKLQPFFFFFFAALILRTAKWPGWVMAKASGAALQWMFPCCLKRNVMSSSAGAPLWFCLVRPLRPFDDIKCVACVVPLRESRSLDMYPATINTSLSSFIQICSC